MAKTIQQDIVIRFTGQNLLGPTIQGFQKQLNDAAKQSQKYNFMPVGQALNAQYRERFDIIRRSEERALKLRNFYARKQAEVDWAGYRGIGKKIAGSAGLAAGFVGEMSGDSGFGRAASAVGNIGGQAAMGFMATGSPWGAAIFGGIEALKQFRNELNRSSEELKKQKEARIEAQRMKVSEMQERMGGVSEIRRELVGDLAQTPASIRARLAEQVRLAREREESAKRDTAQSLYVSRYTSRAQDRQEAEARNLAYGLAQAERNQAEQELAKVDHRMMWDRFAGRMGNIGQGLIGERGRLSALGFTRGFGTAGRTFFGGLTSAASGVGAGWEMNQAARLETESAAERMRRELGLIASQERNGLSPENARRRRRQLYFSGIGQLTQESEVPSLAATTGRFITRGPAQKQVDELSAMRREAKEHARANETALRELLNELRGEGEQS